MASITTDVPGASHALIALYDHGKETVVLTSELHPEVLTILPNPIRPGGTSLDSSEVHAIARAVLRTVLMQKNHTVDAEADSLVVNHVVAGKTRREFGTRSSMARPEPCVGPSSFGTRAGLRTRAEEADGDGDEDDQDCLIDASWGGR